MGGEEGPPYVFLDFLTYHFDDREKMLVSFLGIFGDGEGKINPLVSNLIVERGLPFQVLQVQGQQVASGRWRISRSPRTMSC